MDTNFLGAVYCARAALPFFRRAGGGDLVNVSSDSAADPWPGLGVYAATKAALELWTRDLRRELAPEGVRVTLVRAGPTLTDFAAGFDPAVAAAAFARWRAEGRLADGVLAPERVAEAVAFALARPPGAAVELLEIRPTAAARKAP